MLLDVPPGDSGMRWIWADEGPEKMDPRREHHPEPAILRAWREWEAPTGVGRAEWTPFRA